MAAVRRGCPTITETSPQARNYWKLRKPPGLKKEGVLVVVILVVFGPDPSEQAMVLAINASREKKVVSSTGQTTIAKGQGPKAFDGYRVAFLLFELTKELVGSVKGINAAIAKIAHE